MSKTKTQKAQEDTQAHALQAEQKSVLKKLKAGELTEAEATQAMKDLKAKYPLGVGVHPSSPPRKEDATQPAAVGKEPGQINGDTGKVNPEAKATATPAPAVATTLGASKQDMAIEKLKAGWLEKKVDLSKLTIKDDGKFKVLIVAEGWPRVTIGPTGGIVVTDLKSYTKAFDAAMDGLNLYTKQKEREAKKATTVTATASEPTPAPAEVKTKAA
jgi:hypothetical protein